jgi:hypothetical protein
MQTIPLLIIPAVMKSLRDLFFNHNNAFVILHSECNKSNDLLVKSPEDYLHIYIKCGVAADNGIIFPFIKTAMQNLEISKSSINLPAHICS